MILAEGLIVLLEYTRSSPLIERGEERGREREKEREYAKTDLGVSRGNPESA